MKLEIEVSMVPAGKQKNIYKKNPHFLSIYTSTVYSEITKRKHELYIFREEGNLNIFTKHNKFYQSSYISG